MDMSYPEGGIGASPLVSLTQDMHPSSSAPQSEPALAARPGCQGDPATWPVAKPLPPAQAIRTFSTYLGPYWCGAEAQGRGPGVRCYCPLLATSRIFQADVKEKAEPLTLTAEHTRLVAPTGTSLQ